MNTTNQSNNEVPQSTTPQITIVTPQGTVLTREDAGLIDMMSCLPQIDSLRTEVRSWFLAYVSNMDPSRPDLTCDYYETLDSFFGTIINKGIEQLLLARKGGQTNE